MTDATDAASIIREALGDVRPDSTVACPVKVAPPYTHADIAGATGKPCECHGTIPHPYAGVAALVWEQGKHKQDGRSAGGLQPWAPTPWS